MFQRFFVPARDLPPLFTEDATNAQSGRAAQIRIMYDFLIDHAPEHLSREEQKDAAQKALPLYWKLLEEITGNPRTWGTKKNTIQHLREYEGKCREMVAGE